MPLGTTSTPYAPPSPAIMSSSLPSSSSTPTSHYSSKVTAAVSVNTLPAMTSSQPVTPLVPAMPPPTAPHTTSLPSGGQPTPLLSAASQVERAFANRNDDNCDGDRVRVNQKLPVFCCLRSANAGNKIINQSQIPAVILFDWLSERLSKCSTERDGQRVWVWVCVLDVGGSRVFATTAIELWL